MVRKLPAILLVPLLLLPQGVCTCHASLPAWGTGHGAQAPGDADEDHAPDADPCCPGHGHDHPAPCPADHAPGCPALKPLDRQREAGPGQLAALVAGLAAACPACPAPALLLGRLAVPPATLTRQGRPLFLTLRTLLI
jgi:hypothetical protein